MSALASAMPPAAPQIAPGGIRLDFGRAKMVSEIGAGSGAAFTF
jgi:hypothetical protein